MSDTKHEILGVPKESGIPFHYQSAKIMSSDTTGTLSEPRWHEELEIKLFLSGHAEIIVGADLFIAGPGDITVINPCQLHGTKPAGDEDAVYHLLMIPCDPAVPGLDRHLKNLMSGRVIIDNHITRDTETADSISSLISELENGDDTGDAFVYGYLSLLIGRLIRYHSKESGARNENIVKYSDVLRPALTEIGTRYYTNITLGELAESCGLSVAHFSRLFRLVTGHTMTEYLMRIRISKAMTLLKSQDVSVSDAAAEVGYTDPAYFSRVFRAVTGLPPREWIRQMTAEKESK